MASAWNLDELGNSYAEFIRTFRPVLRRLEPADQPDRGARQPHTGDISVVRVRRHGPGSAPGAAAEAVATGRGARPVRRLWSTGWRRLAVERVRHIVSKYDR